ncbi:MAG: hypothetical protein HYR72_15880 [Deltaproteobacteria bacterium]|nr:hypothetical protein [Deltaproteobacteria bacterium]MBI3390234.1 hypothetical protein [Deltaproteobacteria bacterium]
MIDHRSQRPFANVILNEARNPSSIAWSLILGVLGTTIALIFAHAAAGLIDDDAYIFLRYAEHLANGDGLAFNVGEPSAGVTSVLWVGVLAGVRWLTDADLIVIAQTVGAVCFGGALAIMTWTVEADGQAPVARVAGVVAALSPVFICQAISGMEVALNMLLVAAAIAAISRAGLLASVTTGLAYLTRPDNLVLAPVLLALRPRRRALATIGACVIVCALPWALYCHHVSGSFLPPTRIGKLLVFLPGWYGITLAEFSALPIVARLAFTLRALERVALLFTEGQARVLVPWLLLLPFGLAHVKRAVRAPLVLLVLSAIAYALFFPLVKLRYFVHLLPWLIPIALAAITRLTQRSRRVLFVLILFAQVALCWRALPRYRDWVTCEGTKTRAGKWLAEHTAPDARLALEPIGAIGYYSHRYIVDLGGLISADVWPVIRNGPDFDPNELLAYLRMRHADYLIDAVDGPWAGRLLRALPDALHLEATIRGLEGCGAVGVYAVQR